MSRLISRLEFSELSLRRWVWVLVAGGVIARIAAGLFRGDEPLLLDGYEFYVTISRNFLDGVGLCYSEEGGCAIRMPLYPLWLAPFLLLGALYPGVVIAQALIGGVLIWTTWQIGTRLFDGRVGLMAAVAAAVNPYAVIHDTALQDTVFVNVLIPLAILAMLRARSAPAPAAWWVGAGVTLAAAVLANARIALFVPPAVAWVVSAGGRDFPARARAAALVTLPVFLLVGGWMVRNWQVVGAPVLTTEAGERLWFGNNPWTFTHFPERSIDLTAAELQAIPAEQRSMLTPFAGTEPQRDALVAGWAFDYMAADPLRTVTFAARKVWVAASAQLSPARGPIVQYGYALVFLPVHVLAMAALWRTRADWRAHGLTWCLLLSFGITTAAYWAHTSHKSYLDAVLFVYAAATVRRILPRRPGVPS